MNWFPSWVGVIDHGFRSGLLGEPSLPRDAWYHGYWEVMFRLRSSRSDLGSVTHGELGNGYFTDIICWKGLMVSVDELEMKIYLTRENFDGRP